MTLYYPLKSLLASYAATVRLTKYNSSRSVKLNLKCQKNQWYYLLPRRKVSEMCVALICWNPRYNSDELPRLTLRNFGISTENLVVLKMICSNWIFNKATTCVMQISYLTYIDTNTVNSCSSILISQRLNKKHIWWRLLTNIYFYTLNGHFYIYINLNTNLNILLYYISNHKYVSI